MGGPQILGDLCKSTVKLGAVALLENQLGRPLIMGTCLLHLNELPLRHIIETLDGKATDAKNWTGEDSSNKHR